MEDKELIDLLSSPDMRSVAGVDEAVALVEKKAASFATLVEGLEHGSPAVRMRCADAIEKLTREHREWLQPFRGELLKAARQTQQEVRWHMAQVLPRLKLTPAQNEKAYEIVSGYLDDGSSIVKASAMQALAELGSREAGLREKVRPLIEKLTRTGTPAMRARGRKLLKELKA